MNHRYFASLVLIMIFVFPVLSNSGTNMPSDGSYFESPNVYDTYTNSGNPVTGTGPSLSVSMTGVATDRLGGTLQIDSSTSGIRTVTLDDGWTGDNL